MHQYAAVVPLSVRIGVALVAGMAWAAGCSSRSATGGPSSDERDMTLVFAAPPDLTAAKDCTSDGDCVSPERCLRGVCQLPAVPCTNDDDCQDDTTCVCGSSGDAGLCLDSVCRPWTGMDPAYDPSCGPPAAFSVDEFKPPTEKCHWDGGTVVMTPLVIDLDKDHRPEIVFTVSQLNTIVAIHGDTCLEKWRVTGRNVGGVEQLAAADLDGDGFPEVIVPGAGGKGSETLTLYDHDGKELAAIALDGQGNASDGPAIADINNKAPPEIALGGSVFRYQGGVLTRLWGPVAAELGTFGSLPLFADMDGDGQPDLVTGLHVYDGAGIERSPKRALGSLGDQGGYPAVADFNGDGSPDIVLVQPGGRGDGKVTVIDFANDKILLGPYTVLGEGLLGPSTVGDFDGDGVPDVGFASASHYFVLALKCAQQNKPADCKGMAPGVLWERATVAYGAGVGSSTFDFNGDGISEIVYGDECWLRVFNGPDGRTLLAENLTSGTAIEYPVIADVDNSGHAAIVRPSGGGGVCDGIREGQLDMVSKGYTKGVYVLVDPLNRWMPARPLWHQYTFHITELGDDLQVPAFEKSNWLSWNNFRGTGQGAVRRPQTQPDLTGGAVAPVDNGGFDCTVSERLWASVCNRGAARVEAGVPGTFYDADPRQPGAKVLCSTATTDWLGPGQCEVVHCDRKNPPADPQDLWFRADDDGLNAPSQSECKPKNDLLFLPQYVCKNIG